MAASPGPKSVPRGHHLAGHDRPGCYCHSTDTCHLPTCHRGAGTLCTGVWHQARMAWLVVAMAAMAAVAAVAAVMALVALPLAAALEALEPVALSLAVRNSAALPRRAARCIPASWWCRASCARRASRRPAACRRACRCSGPQTPSTAACAGRVRRRSPERLLAVQRIAKLRLALRRLHLDIASRLP